MPGKASKKKEETEEPNVETTPLGVVPAEISQPISRPDPALTGVNSPLAGGGGVPGGKIAAMFPVPL